jgi:hypothetical protein
MTILSLIILALIGEAVWETSKMVWQNGKISVDKVGAIIVAEVLVFGAGMDMFVLIGLPLRIPYVGLALTGLLISRGANFVHDLLAKIANTKEIKDVTEQK